MVEKKTHIFAKNPPIGGTPAIDLIEMAIVAARKGFHEPIPPKSVKYFALVLFVSGEADEAGGTDEADEPEPDVRTTSCRWVEITDVHTLIDVII